VSEVIRHVVASITPASAAHAEGARLLVAGAGAPMLERLAALLGAAQHTARPRSTHRTIVVVAGDHGVGDPGVALGADHPTVIAAHAITGGSAALAQVARASHTPIVVVDAGALEGASMPATAVRLGRAASRNLTLEPAMTLVDATLGLEAGIALALSLSDAEVLAVGALGVGAEVASAALLGAASGRSPGELGDHVAEAAGIQGAAAAGDSGLAWLAAFGGPETAVLAGLMLAAASMNVPVILDGYATGAAALVAARLAPAVRGYLIAAHLGSFTQPAILAHLGLAPLFEVGLGHGEGTGAAMVLPLIDQVAAIASRG
jgi:nicotinate-nucleotide--dimethylbenzimidazole phosphoribosyltransferase